VGGGDIIGHGKRGRLSPGTVIYTNNFLKTSNAAGPEIQKEEREVHRNVAKIGVKRRGSAVLLQDEA